MIPDIPKYMIVVDEIEKIIKTQEVNTLIPSERNLSLSLDISRMTVRKAIDILVNQGKLYRVNNVGTFISEQKLYKVFNTLTGFTDEVLSTGGTVQNEVLLFEKLRADEWISNKLGIEENDLVYKLIRLRKKDSIPLMIQETYLPVSLIPLTKKIVQNSIYHYITHKLNYQIISSIEEIKAILIHKDYATLLEMKENEPTIKTEQISYLANGKIFEYTISYKNQNKYELVVQAMNVRKSL
ncbi:MAG: GntR family transcriptional regulator [Firmicutes bacterium]|nr:GntR family transcriptional regulator [Bacillota bacterium]